MYASDNGAGRRALERSCTKKKCIFGARSYWRKKNVFFFLLASLRRQPIFLGWLAGWLAI
jgi:hypothetical protein